MEIVKVREFCAETEDLDGDEIAGFSADCVGPSDIDLLDWMEERMAKQNQANSKNPNGNDSRVKERRILHEKEESSRVPDLAYSWSIPNRWHRVIEGAWSSHSDIMSQEAKISLLGFVHSSRCAKLHHTKILSIGDNLSEICAVEKGLNATCIEEMYARALPSKLHAIFFGVAAISKLS